MEIFFLLGAILGIVIIGSALIASFGEYDNNKWKNKGY